MVLFSIRFNRSLLYPWSALQIGVGTETDRGVIRGGLQDMIPGHLQRALVLADVFLLAALGLIALVT